jgi:hypothetical protein
VGAADTLTVEAVKDFGYLGKVRSKGGGTRAVHILFSFLPPLPRLQLAQLSGGQTALVTKEQARCVLCAACAAQATPFFCCVCVCGGGTSIHDLSELCAEQIRFSQPQRAARARLQPRVRDHRC